MRGQLSITEILLEIYSNFVLVIGAKVLFEFFQFK